MPSWLAGWIPPLFRQWANRLLGASIVYRGPRGSFAEAQAACRGYSDPSILADVESATRAVISGDARYEQDGRTFEVEPPSEYALSGILLAAARTVDRLTILDLGGGLGSHFLRWQPFLSTLPRLHWIVIEQPHFVTTGRRLFSGNAQISFEDATYRPRASPNVLLASSVLQYLDEPKKLLRSLIDLNPDVIIIDRTPFHSLTEVLAFCQEVPAARGRGVSYPLHIFPKEWLVTLLAGYELILDFPTRDAPIRTRTLIAEYRGSIWTRKAPDTQ